MLNTRLLSNVCNHVRMDTLGRGVMECFHESLCFQPYLSELVFGYVCRACRYG
jgi:hypothetical protein